ncbi:tigger transposable element-derived protein 4 [Aplysia californica]|uniref:Tigger transposable element-derived protein 4 n=1 Tax=Aplysia californica TaxID=6500 RepID=A0ABM0K9Z4_APLCA|nr:tigger transposable element-derived protein 4 [Aplysia californica]
MKLKLLHDVDSKSMTQSAIAKKYGVAKSTVSTIIKKRSQIEFACNSSIYHPERKRMRTGRAENVEEALFSWFKQAQAMNAPISGEILMNVANQLAEEMKVEFTPRTGWLDRFKKRRGITCKTASREAGSVTAEQTDTWLSSTLPALLLEYSREDIYNCDETGLYYKCLPDKTLALKGETCSGGEKAKHRLTVLVAANMSGTDKLPLLVIGKASKPRCFKNVNTLPLDYTANKKSWMTGAVFEKWLRKMDRKFHSQGHQTLMVVDNCPAHPQVDNLKAIKLVFLPLKATSKLQSCDQGIIQSLKRHYRRQLLQKYILYLQTAGKVRDIDAFDISVLEALYMLQTAWTNVSESTVSNCFRHAGFKTQEARDVEKTPEELADQTDFLSLFERLQNLIPMEETAQAFCDIDSAVIVCEEEATIQGISNAVNNEHDDHDDSGQEEEEAEGEEEQPTKKPKTASEVRAAVTILQEFALEQGNDNLIDLVCSIDNTVTSHLVNRKSQTQTKIDQFFQKKN